MRTSSRVRETSVLSESGVSRIAGSTERLTFNSHVAPEFCQRAQLVIGPDRKIVAFEVLASQADSLVATEVLHAGGSI